MGLLYNLRLWAREAPRAEVRMAATAAVVVVALVAWALFPSGGEDDAGVTVGAPTASGTGGATSAGPAGGGAGSMAGVGSSSGGGAPAAGVDGSLGGGAVGGGPTGAGGGAVAAGDPAGGDPAAGGGPAGGDPAAGGAPPPDGSAPAPDGGSDPAQPTGPLTASDRGVSETTIRLGFVPFPSEVARAAGIPFKFRDDEEEAVQVFVDHINNNGGVLGRKIEIVTRPYTSFEASTARAMCLQFTQQDQVFGMVYSYVGPDPSCLAENQTPFISEAPGSAQDIRNFYPYSISPQAQYNHSGKDMVYGFRDQGFFDPAKGFKKLGIVSTACEAAVWDDPEVGVKRYLKDIGVTQISEYRVDCSIEAINTQHTNALLKHRQDGVTHVVIGAQPIDRNYTKSAQDQGWKPTYGWFDFHWATHDANAQVFDQDNIDGSYGVSMYYHGHPKDSPEAVKCEKILTDAGLAPLTSWTVDLVVLDMCEILRLFVDAARLVGPNLTRDALGRAVERLGDSFVPAVQFAARFGPGKLTGGDMVQFLTYKKACACWQATGPPRPSY